MFKRLAACVREYKLPALLTFVFIVCEAVIETFIPFITANLVNQIEAGAALELVFKTGALLIGMAVLSLSCGGKIKKIQKGGKN